MVAAILVASKHGPIVRLALVQLIWKIDSFLKYSAEDQMSASGRFVESRLWRFRLRVIGFFSK